MNWKRIGRFLVCLALVCCILVNVSPIKAKAVDPLSLSFMGVSAATVLGVVAIGLGLSMRDQPEVWNGVIRDFQSFLEATGEWVHDGLIDVLTVDSGDLQNYFVNQRLVNQFKEWLYDTGVLYTKLTRTAGKLQGIGIKLGASYDLAHEWAAALPLQSMALSAPLGSFLLVEYINNQGGTSMNGFRVSPSAYVGHNVISFVGATSSVSLSPYTSENFPVGQFLTDYGFNSSTATSKIFLSKVGALAFYDYAIANGIDASAYWLTEDSYFDFGKMGTAYQYSYLRGLGSISGSGIISDSGQSTTLYKSFYSHTGITPAGYTSQDILNVVTDIDLTLGNVGLPNQSLSDGYKDWYSGAITVGAQVGLMQDELFYPIVYDDQMQMEDLTQNQVQLGNTIADALIQSDMVTQKGLKGMLDSMLSSISSWFARLSLNIISIPDQIVAGITTTLEALFVPSQDFLTAKVDALRSEFAFADTLITGGQMIGDAFNGFDTSPPIIYIDLGATRGDYDIGGKVPFIDLTWYEEYKPTVDMLLSSFLWVVFVWKLFQKAPGIISGMPGDFVMEGLQSLNMDVYLPMRSQSHEKVRRLNRRSKL